MTAARHATAAQLIGLRNQPRTVVGAEAIAAALMVVNAGFVNASPNALALSNRSAGSFSSDFATAAATFAGTLRAASSPARHPR